MHREPRAEKRLLPIELTRIVECAIVLLVLALIAFAGGAKITDWTASLAVFLGFLCSQISFDLAESAASSSLEPPPAGAFAQLYVIKEGAWILTFALLGSWPLLCGGLMFLCYPMLRRQSRKARESSRMSAH